MLGFRNCKTKQKSIPFRENLKQVIKKLNEEKDFIKTRGVTVDGKKYTIKFTGIYNVIYM